MHKTCITWIQIIWINLTETETNRNRSVCSSILMMVFGKNSVSAYAQFRVRWVVQFFIQGTYFLQRLQSHTMSTIILHTGIIKCFIFQNHVSLTKHLRWLIQRLNWVERWGFTFDFCKIFQDNRTLCTCTPCPKLIMI